MESGVRSLERQIASILRKIARRAVRRGLGPGAAPAAAGDTPPAATPTEPPAAPSFRVVVTPKRVAAWLGPEQHQEKTLFAQPKPGLVYGLAWAESGGTLLPVEVALLEGKGELILTGSLGEVMKESAQTALSFLRANAAALGLPPAFAKKRDIHIHVPEGAIPKDGPSAGIAIAAALLSAAGGRAARSGQAMTGEITLTGRILPIGGVKEKVLAAHRNRFSHVLLPEGNRKDIEELPREVRGAVTFLFADTILEALSLLFPAP
jgi:ATP-dependent Lon protease